MKQSNIFHQYAWLLATLKRYKRMTLEEINERWIADEVAEGNPLPRTTFNRHRDAIFNMFGVIIECGKGFNGYYIANDGVFADGSVEQHNRGTVLLLSCCDNEKTVPVYVPKS